MEKLKAFFKSPWAPGLVIMAMVAFLIFAPITGPGLVQQGTSNFTTIAASDDITVGDDLTVTGAATIGETLGVTGAVTYSAGITTTQNIENVGSVPTVLSVSVDIDNDSSPVTCATIGDGEIWFIHQVYANVLDNFVATGDDATFSIGEASGGDADGLLDLDDAELQAADTEGTGAPAGWQGFMSGDTIGAYLAAGNGFIYAPSGAAETIDCAFAGTDLASTTGTTADDITIYIVYTRIQ